MTEQEALAKMIAPGTPRPGKYRGGVIQIHVTRQCDKACFNCTQGSNYRGPYDHITPKNFEAAVKSLKGYWGVVGVFGGNPALHPQFEQLCDTLAQHVPFEQRGLWCNHPLTLDKTAVMRRTFNPAVSNLNVHLDQRAYELFRAGWPESRPFGLDKDSRHSPVFVAMRDVLRVPCHKCCRNGGWYDDGKQTWMSDPGGIEAVWEQCDVCEGTTQVYDEGRAWELVSQCDINQHWSAMIGQFRGEVRAWFCEIAGAQSILHQHDPDYPDTGIPIMEGYGTDGLSDFSLGDGRWLRTNWWKAGMEHFAAQVRKHCHDCGVPLKGYGELAQAGPEGIDQYSAAHEAVAVPKRVGRMHQPVTTLEQLGVGRLAKTTDYLGNAKR